MITNLPDDLRIAIQQSPNEVFLRDQETSAVYVVVDQATHNRAMRALQAQEDWESVQRGLADRERGNELSLADADAEMRKELGFPPRS
mgnify:CR=1 FL=1